MDILHTRGRFADKDLVLVDKDGTLVDLESIWVPLTTARADWLANQLAHNSNELFSWRRRIVASLGIDPNALHMDRAGPMVNLSTEEQHWCLAAVLHDRGGVSWQEAVPLARQSFEEGARLKPPHSLAAPIEGAADFLREMATKGIKLALLTADETDHAEKTLLNMALRDTFRIVRGGDEAPSKPSPGAIWEICEAMEVPPHKALMIGDSPTDIKTCLAAGVDMLAIETLMDRDALLEIGATETFSDWRELGLDPDSSKQAPGLSSQSVYTLHCDGASRGNPGPAAAAYVLTDANGNVVSRDGKHLGHATNNRAEYEALLMGVREAHHGGAKHLRIKLDSELIVKQLLGEYKIKAAELREVKDRIDAVLASMQWRIDHVPRAQNKQADELCNMVLDGVNIVSP